MRISLDFLLLFAAGALTVFGISEIFHQRWGLGLFAIGLSTAAVLNWTAARKRRHKVERRVTTWSEFTDRPD